MKVNWLWLSVQFFFNVYEMLVYHLQEEHIERKIRLQARKIKKNLAKEKKIEMSFGWMILEIKNSIWNLQHPKMKINKLTSDSNSIRSSSIDDSSST